MQPLIVFSDGKQLVEPMQATASIMAGGDDLVDAEVLAELRLLFGDRAALLISKTRALLAERAATLAAAQDLPDALGRVAHEIAGMAGQIGLKPLARAALAFERASRQGDASGAAALAALAQASLAALPDA